MRISQAVRFSLFLSLITIASPSFLSADSQQHSPDHRFSAQRTTIIEETEAPQRTILPTTRIDEALQVLTSREKDIAINTGQHPAIGRATDGSLMTGYEIDADTASYVLWRYSQDDGQTWNGDMYFTVNNLKFPTLDYFGSGTTFYGTGVTPMNFLSGAGVILFEFNDITDSTTWLPYWTDYSDNGWYGMKSIDLATSNTQQTWNWGLSSLVMSISDAQYNVADAPAIYSQISALGYVQLSWYPNKGGCDHTATCIDTPAARAYSAYDRWNAPRMQWEIFLRRDHFDDWSQTVTAATLQCDDTTQQMQRPAIAAYGDTILVIAETWNRADSANSDIVCWAGFDGTVSGMTCLGAIAASNDAETAPELAHLGGNDFVCTYAKNGNLYAQMTCDGGLTWSAALKINTDDGSVTGRYATADISSDGDRVVWEFLSAGDSVIAIDTLGTLDTDNDGIALCEDNCPFDPNPGQADGDGDGVGDACDACPGFDDFADADSDTIADGCDNCPAVANNNQDDFDSDGIGDACDICTDSDGDGFGDPGFPANTCPEDNCPDDYNLSQIDGDSDTIGDDCDNCPADANTGQQDTDGDDIGDVCDLCTDTDGDGFGDPGFAANTCPDDNCPSVSNPDQTDTDHDGIGDACNYICGDANGDGFANVGDAVYIINYAFRGGPAPYIPGSGDANCDGNTNIGDAVYLISYVFRGGPPPCCP